MKTIKLSILLLFACTLAIAQSSLNSITLTNAITDTNTEQITLSSMAAVNVGDLLFVDREAMKVVRVGLVTVSVIRGSNSRAAIHAAGATVLSGSPDKFFSYDPPAGGPCTATALPVTPLVNISNGNQWTCTNGIYVQSAGAGGATHWGAVLGTLSDQTDLQTALNGKVGTARTVNGHALSANVAVTYGDLGVIPAADLPNPGASSLGGVQSKDCSGVGLLQKINTDGTVTCAAASAVTMPYVIATQTAAYSAQANASVVTFDTNATGSTGSMHSTSSNTSRFIAPNTGLYEARCVLVWASGASGQWGSYLQVNGTTRKVLTYFASIVGFDAYPVSGLFTLTAGDYVECITVQAGSATLTPGVDQTQFSLRQIQ